MRISNAPWLKIVEFREPAADDRWITGRGLIASGKDENGFLRPIVAPDNVYNALDLSALKIPEGYEIDGASAAEAFGEVGEIQLFLSKGGSAGRGRTAMAFRGIDTRRIRLRKIAPKTQTWVIVESCDPIVIKAWKREYDGSRHAPRVALKSEERPI